MGLGPETECAVILRSCGTGLVKLNELSSILSIKKKNLFQLKFYGKGGSVGFITSEQFTHEVKYVDNCWGLYCAADCVHKHLFQEILAFVKCAGFTTC